MPSRRRPTRAGWALGLAFALVNLAWAVGQVGGAGIGGVLAKATVDAVPFLIVSCLCLVTFAALRSPRTWGAKIAPADL